MNGADYLATVRLSTKQNETLAEPGEPCERVPASSLPWLAAQGLIVTRQQAEDAADVAAAQAALQEPGRVSMDTVIDALGEE